MDHGRMRWIVLALAAIAGVALLYRHIATAPGAADAPTRAGAEGAMAPADSPHSPPTAPPSMQAASDLDDRPFVEARAELERRAERGDARAAARLGRAFAQCNGYVPVDDAQLESWVVEATARGVVFNEGDHPLGPDALLARLKANQAQRARDCANAGGIDEKDPRPLAFRWTERAAALGDADAQALYGSLAFATYSARSAIVDAEELRERKRIARDYLERSLARGDALALQQMYLHHAHGTLYPEDAEAAYRYLYAYSLTPRSVELAPDALARLLDEAAAPLDDAARERARSAARALAACCMSPGAP
jgi:hypothetical protein